MPPSARCRPWFNRVDFGMSAACPVRGLGSRPGGRPPSFRHTATLFFPADMCHAEAFIGADKLLKTKKNWCATVDESGHCRGPPRVPICATDRNFALRVVD